MLLIIKKYRYDVKYPIKLKEVYVFFISCSVHTWSFWTHFKIEIRYIELLNTSERDHDLDDLLWEYAIEWEAHQGRYVFIHLNLQEMKKPS